MIDFGDVPASTVLYIPFASYGKTNGESITLTGLAVTDIEIYKNGSTTQRSSDNGYTLLDTDGIDFDGITGIHGFSVDLSDNSDASFYAVGSRYFIVVSSVTVDSQTVSFIAATFRIVAAEAITGKPKVDVDGWLGTAAATPTVAGVPEVDVTYWRGGAVPNNAITGVPVVDVFYLNSQADPVDIAAGFFGGYGTIGDIYMNSLSWSGAMTAIDMTKINNIATSGVIADAVWDEARAGHVTAGTFGEYVPASVTHWLGTACATPTTAGVPEVDVTYVDGNSSSARSLKKIFDGSGADVTIGTLTVTTNAMAWNASWDAEVQSEVQDAIEVNNLDHLVKSAVDTDFATTVHLNSVIGHLADNGTSATFDRTTDSLEAIYNSIDAVPTTTEIATAVWGEAQEGGYTARQIHELTAAVMYGILSGMDTGTPVFKGLDGTTNRVTATVDSYGNRSGFTITPRAV